MKCTKAQWKFIARSSFHEGVILYTEDICPVFCIVDPFKRNWILLTRPADSNCFLRVWQTVVRCLLLKNVKAWSKSKSLLCCACIKNCTVFPAQHSSSQSSSSSCSIHSKGNTVMRFHIWLWTPEAGLSLFDFHVVLLLRVLPCTGTCGHFIKVNYFALQTDASLCQVQTCNVFFQKVLNGLV